MSYIVINTPPYPFFLFAGDALYRPGDAHRKRSSLHCFDVLFVEHGCLYMTENQINYKVQENEILVLSPNHEHQSYKRCDKETYFHWLHFYTTEPYEITDNYHKPLPTSRDFDYRKIETSHIILSSYQKMDPSTASDTYMLLRQLESLSVNRYRDTSVVNKEDSFSKDRLLQQKIFFELFSNIVVQEEISQKLSATMMIVIKYIESHFAEDISLEGLASIANCHPTHLIRCFKNEYGTTPGKVLTNIRVNNAKDLLSSTSFSCERVAELTGFSTGAYFSKVFKSYVGITPKKYRQEKLFL